MSYSNMSGLDLFQTPFHRSQSTKPQASGQQANRQKPGAADLQPKTEEAPTAHQPKPVASSAQHKRPETSAVLPDQTDTASRTDLPTKQPVSEPKAQSLQTGAAVPEDKAVSAQPEEAARNEESKVPEQHQEAQADPKSNDSADPKKQTEPQKELVLDMSSGTTDGNTPASDDDAKRKAHEAAEEKRKSEWEENQRVKKQAEKDALQKINAMSDTDIVEAAARRVGAETERITRRNMKEAVAEYIISHCKVDPIFARRVMDPSKNMSNCFRYINRMACDFLQEEMKNNGLKPENGIYGGDVPDEIVYQFSVDYYHSDNLPEDQTKEEKFVPKPYTGASSKPKKSASKSKKSDKPAKKESKEKQETAGNGYEQMTLEV